MRLKELVKLAVDAAKVELGLLFRAVDEADAEEAVAPVVEPPTKTDAWDCNAFLASVRADKRCPFCAKPKTVGDMLCTPCDDYRKPLRAKAAAA